LWDTNGRLTQVSGQDRKSAPGILLDVNAVYAQLVRIGYTLEKLNRRRRHQRSGNNGYE
jgi:hypothetical protein